MVLPSCTATCAPTSKLRRAGHAGKGRSTPVTLCSGRRSPVEASWVVLVREKGRSEKGQPDLTKYGSLHGMKGVQVHCQTLDIEPFRRREQRSKRARVTDNVNCDSSITTVELRICGEIWEREP